MLGERGKGQGQKRDMRHTRLRIHYGSLLADTVKKLMSERLQRGYFR